MARAYKYKGHRILNCAWAGDPHGGRWYVQSYHESGMQWADEATPHHRTLAEAKEYIREAIEDVAYALEEPAADIYKEHLLDEISRLPVDQREQAYLEYKEERRTNNDNQTRR